MSSLNCLPEDVERPSEAQPPRGSGVTSRLLGLLRHRSFERRVSARANDPIELALASARSGADAVLRLTNCHDPNGRIEI
jgi:hypothetical protein